VLTGYYATKKALEHGESITLNTIPSTAETVPEVLKQLGYRTFAVADNVNISERLGFSRGFDRFAPHNQAGSEVLNAKLRKWRAELRSSGKFFLYVHYNDAHVQIRTREKGTYRKRKPWYDENVEPAQERVEAYNSNLSHMDERVKEIFELFGLEQNALVVITADHGEEFGDHGGHEHQNKLYDELLRVPLILYQPGRIGRRRVSEPVSTIDLLPTFREAAGGKPGPSDEGVSLFQTIEGPAPAEPRTFFPMRFKETGRRPHARKAVVRARWKYILTLPQRAEELYDLEADPKELTNLAGEHPQVVAELRGRLESFEKTAKVHKREFGGATHISPEKAEQLRALGYVQ
jgi:arylsulfatase A-like enzyme